MVNNKGFSLVELVVGAGVLALVSLALIDVTKLISSSSRGQETHSNAATLGAMIGQNLRFESTCATTIKNGAADVPYDRNQALDVNDADGITGMPIAITIPGLRAGPLGTLTQISGTNNAVSVGVPPTFPGSTSDLSVYGLEVRRIAFIQLAESVDQRFGYVYIDLEIPNTRTVFGGNAIRRKILGGVVLEAAGATVTSCYGNSPETDLASACTSMGCTWTAPNCECPKPNFTCGPGELFWGITADTGLPICKELGGGSCPPGQYVSGIGLERVICSAVPDEPIVMASTDCPAASLSWTVGTVNCSASVPATTDTFLATATDSTAPETGSASFRCNAGTWGSAEPGATCAAAVTCTGGATTTVTANPASPTGCYCPVGQAWNPMTSMCVPPGVPIVPDVDRRVCNNAAGFYTIPSYGVDICDQGPYPPHICPFPTHYVGANITIRVDPTGPTDIWGCCACAPGSTTTICLPNPSCPWH